MNEIPDELIEARDYYHDVQAKYNRVKQDYEYLKKEHSSTMKQFERQSKAMRERIEEVHKEYLTARQNVQGLAFKFLEID